jgi:hypothetical protein
MIQLSIEESSAARSPNVSQKQRIDFLRCLYDLTHGSDTTPIYIEEIVEALHLEEEEAEAILQSLAEKALIKIRLQCIIYLTQAGIDEVKTAEVKAAAERPDMLAAPVPAVQTVLTETPGAQLLGFLGGEAAPVSGDVQPPAARFVDVSQNTEELAPQELKYLCEAIGLNPAEFTNERAAWAAFDADRQKAGSLHRPPSTARAGVSLFQADDLPDILASLKLRLLKVRLAPDDMAEAEAEIATAIAQLLSPRPKLQIIAASLNTLLSILENSGTDKAGTDKARTAPLTSDIEMSLTRVRFFLKQLPV